MLSLLSFFKITIIFLCLSFLPLCASDADFDEIEKVDAGFKVSFVNIGQGNGVVALDMMTGKRIFIDAGSSKHPINPYTGDASLAFDSIKPYMEFLPNLLAIHPVAFICSHSDKDHLNLFSDFIDYSRDQLNINLSVSFYLGGSFEKYLFSKDSLDFFNSILTLHNPTVFSLSHNLSIHEMHDLKAYLEALKTDIDIATGYEGIEEALTRIARLRIKDKVRPFILRSKLMNFSTEDRVIVEILGANAGHCPTRNYGSSDCFEEEAHPIQGEIVNHEENMSSSVLRLIFYNNFSVIITGDATGVTTDRIIHNFSVLGSPYNSLFCHVLLACHHGAITEESNNQEWIFATQPVHVIFSAGKYKGYNHPQFDAVYNYSISPRITKEMADHIIICGRNKEKEGGAKTKPRLINVSEHAFIKTYKKLDTDWHQLTTSYGIFSTYSSGSIICNVGVNGFMEALVFE